METDDPGREENLQSLEMGRPSEGRWLAGPDHVMSWHETLGMRQTRNCKSTPSETFDVKAQG